MKNDGIHRLLPRRSYLLPISFMRWQVRWALAIKSAISNKGTSGRVQAKESTEVNWERFDVTFETKAPLLLNVKGVANRNDLQQVTNHWIVVTGFAKSKSGASGPAETSGKIKQMDIVGGFSALACRFLKSIREMLLPTTVDERALVFTDLCLRFC